tara:strand:+ start:322 stop:603 length:282 start_codon:yes stop_codon:yes gene_type:complete
MPDTDRTTETMIQAHKACLDGADSVNVVIATHAKGDSATNRDYAWDLTHDEKKERVKRSVGYLKYQKETYSDWGDKDFTVINAAITAADNFTG